MVDKDYPLFLNFKTMHQEVKQTGKTKLNMETTQTKSLPVYMDGEPILRVKCDPVGEDDKLAAQIVDRIKDSIDAAPLGLGMAAPQIGFAVRIFVIGNSKDDNQIPNITMINPEIIDYRGARKTDMEGCLSLPNVYARVERWQKITVRYYDLEFNEHIQKFKNFDARIIQHEMDHLNGVQFYDRISEKAKQGIQRKIDQIQTGIIPENIGYEVYSTAKTRNYGKQVQD